MSLALKKLASSDRFSAEIDGLLQTRGYGVETIKAVLELLHKRRVLDDRRTVSNALERYSGKRAKGKETIRAELIARGAPEDIVEEALASDSEESERAKAISLLEKRKLGRAEAAKAARFLLSRGFDEELTRSVVGEFFDVE
ncbi:MAG TPA: RecX family transcriptional regulator [Fimbriimonadaceae bacterium]|nr:RecX family transcriptional regulator [Fimbriimonadaceae bacterium]